MPEVLAEAEEMVLDRRVGSSRMSETRSTFRESSIASFLRSRTALSELVFLYFVEKEMAAWSRAGMAS